MLPHLPVYPICSMAVNRNRFEAGTLKTLPLDSENSPAPSPPAGEMVESRNGAGGEPRPGRQVS